MPEKITNRLVEPLEKKRVEPLGEQRMWTEKRGKNRNVLFAFYAACIAIIVMDGALLGEILFRWIVIDSRFPCDVKILILTVVLNIFEIMNNWASIKCYIQYYTRPWFLLLDIMTLGVFYIQIYTLSKVITSETEIDCADKSAWFVFLCWVSLYMLYTLWNRLMLRNNEISQIDFKALRTSQRIRIIQVAVGMMLAVVGISKIVFLSEIVRDKFELLVMVYIIASGMILIATRKVYEMLKIIINSEEIKHIG